MNSPIALFLYNRPNHTLQTINALLNCKECAQTPIYIFLDGPKSDASIFDLEQIAMVKNIALSLNGFKSIKIIEQHVNLGLSKSLLNGISEVLQNFSNVIVLEDDICVAKDFLYYMNLALNQYQNDIRVAGISGYSFPIGVKEPYFTRTGSCWGWGTYKRVWEHFIQEREKLDLNLIAASELNLFNVYDGVYSNMFEQNKAKQIQSWAIEFYLYYFSQKQYFLMPGINLVSNVGFDGSGAHQKNGNFLTDNNPIGNLHEVKFPETVSEDLYIRKKIEKLYKIGYGNPNSLLTFFNKIKTLLLGNEKFNY